MSSESKPIPAIVVIAWALFLSAAFYLSARALNLEQVADTHCGATQSLLIACTQYAGR